MESDHYKLKKHFVVINAGEGYIYLKKKNENKCWILQRCNILQFCKK